MNPATRIAWAIRIATDAHRGQVRTDPRGDLPYIVHPLRVAALVGAHGGSPDAVAAAILHDVLEDTPVTGEGWPTDILAMVRGCTKRPDQDRLSCLINLREAPPEAILVKLADRYDNLTAEADGSAYARKRLVCQSTLALAAMARQAGIGKELAAAITPLVFSPVNEDEDLARTLSGLPAQAPCPPATIWVSPWGSDGPPRTPVSGPFQELPPVDCEARTVLTTADGRRWLARLAYAPGARLRLVSLIKPDGELHLKPGTAEPDDLVVWFNRALSQIFPITWDSAAVFASGVPGVLMATDLCDQQRLQTALVAERAAVSATKDRLLATRHDLVEPNDYHESAYEDRLDQRLDRLDDQIKDLRP